MDDGNSTPTKTCTKCGVEKSDSAFPWHTKAMGIRRVDCIQCRRGTGKKYHADNKDAINAKKRDRYPEIADRHNATTREWYYRNHEVEKAKRDTYRAENPEKALAATRAYRAANPEKCKAAEDAYAQANPWVRRVITQNRRARMKAAGEVPHGVVQLLLTQQKWKCVCCGADLKADGFHLDHIQPLAGGGLNSIDNLQLLTPKCNLQKGAKHPIDFMQSRGFLL